MEKPMLFYRDQCPFSRRVLKYLDEHNLRSTVELKDVDDNVGLLRELRSLIQKTQVPCLVVDGTPMLESAAIIEWFDEHFPVTPTNGAGLNGRPHGSRVKPTIEPKAPRPQDTHVP